MRFDYFKLIVAMLFSCLAGFLGAGSKYVIYDLNKFMGIGYANYASYMITALLTLVFVYPLIDWSKPERKR